MKSAAVSICEHGARGDGRTDDTAAIQAALNTGARRVVIPEGIFIISSPVEPCANQEIEIIGTLKIADARFQRVTADVAAGQSAVTVADAGGFRVGQWVTVCDDTNPIQCGGARHTRQFRADCGRIVRVENNTLHLAGRFVRSYSPAANARLASQSSAILIQNKSNISIYGSGTVDGNKANQMDVEPFTMAGCGVRKRADGIAGGIGDDGGAEIRAGSGIVSVGAPASLENIVIEGITVRNAVVHNICLAGLVRGIIRKTTCVAAHDKNITLLDSCDCRIEHNYALYAEFEDGIMFHQLTGNRRILVRGNTCVGNPRFGIHAGAGEDAIHLTGNLCVDNGCNIYIHGANCSSVDDVCIGESMLPRSLEANRPRVWLAGQNMRVTNLTSIGSRRHNVRITARDLVWRGGRIRGLGDDAANIGLVFHKPEDLQSPLLTDAAQVQVREVQIEGCALGVWIGPWARELKLRDNSFIDNGDDVGGDADARRLVDFDGHQA